MKAIFTFTLGRTGTKYLAEALAANTQDALCVHEYIGPDAFGMDAPDIGTMMRFNTNGVTQENMDFWEKKFRRIKRKVQQSGASLYVETSHQLCKGGLIENLHRLEADDVKIVCLKRDLVPVALSYRTRNEWFNKTVPWLWYLDPAYKENLNPQPPLREHGVDAMSLWYMKEMQLREERYRRNFSHEYDFVDVRLEEISHPKGIRQMLERLEIEPPRSVQVPPPIVRNAFQDRVYSDREDLYRKIKQFL